MPSAVFEPAIAAINWRQTYACYLTAIGCCIMWLIYRKYRLCKTVSLPSLVDTVQMLLVAALFIAFIDTVCTEYIAVFISWRCEYRRLHRVAGKMMGEWWIGKNKEGIVRSSSGYAVGIGVQWQTSEYGERQPRWPMFQPRFELTRTYRIQTWSITTTPAYSIIHGAVLIFFFWGGGTWFIV